MGFSGLILSGQTGQVPELMGQLVRKRTGRKPESPSSRFDIRYSDDQLEGAGNEQFIGVGQFGQAEVFLSCGDAERSKFPQDKVSGNATQTAGCKWWREDSIVLDQEDIRRCHLRYPVVSVQQEGIVATGLAGLSQSSGMKGA